VNGKTDKITVCRLKEEYITVTGNIQASITEDGAQVIMVNNRDQDVKVICQRQQEGTLEIRRQKQPQKEPVTLFEDPSGGIYSANMTLWQANKNELWNTEYDVECGKKNKEDSYEDSLCALKVVEVQDEMELKTNCTKEGNGKVMCNITNWTNKAKQAKNGACKDGKFSPSFNYFSYISGNETWVGCGGSYTDNGTLLNHNNKHNKVDNVKHIRCNISETETTKGEPVLIKMEKTYPKENFGTIIPGEFKCKETSVFSIYLSAPKASGLSENSEVAQATYSAIGLIGTMFLIILAVCCWKQRQNHLKKKETKKDKSGIVNNDSEINNYMDNGPLIHGVQNDGSNNKSSLSDSITTISIEELDECKPNKDRLDVTDRATVVNLEASESIIINDLSNQAKNKQAVMKNLLEGNASKLNPDLPITQQAKLLPYNYTFEVKKCDFTISHIIGEGQFGSVFVGTAKGIYSPGDTKVAIKQVKDTLNDNQLTTIIDELKILSNLQMHINLVNLLGACTEDIHVNEVYLLLEYCPFGDLKKFLLERRDKFMSTMRKQVGYMESPFNSKLLLSWCYSMAKGMEYLESKKIMHGDLAARNILVGENFVAKISDFGLSKQMYYNQDYKKTNRRLIPWAWMATEYLQTGEFNIKSDVWSFGVVLWEIFSLGNKPYGIEAFEETKNKILSGYRLPSPDNMDLLDDGLDVYSQVMLPCWAGEAARRPTFKSLSAQLGDMYGEEGLTEYEDLVLKYNQRQTSLRTDLSSTASGYVMVGHNEEEKQQGYIEMKTDSVGYSVGEGPDTPPPQGYVTVDSIKSINAGASPVSCFTVGGPSPGYCEAVVQPGGAIGLSQPGGVIELSQPGGYIGLSQMT